MLDEKGSQRLWDDLHRLWILPEVERRSREGTLPAKLGIRNCLIRLPQDNPPIVQFNDEIHFLTTIKKPVGIAIEKGDPVFLWQVERVTGVDRPAVDGKPVAFFYIYWNGRAWEVIFDGSPDFPGATVAGDDEQDWPIGQALANALNLQFRERALALHDSIREQILAIGLWPAPALLPYPLTAIAERCHNNAMTEARQLLVDYCATGFLTSLVESWSMVPEFASRTRLFEQALEAHRDSKFILSIHAIVPQIEGVVTDWLYSKKAIGNAYRELSKVKRFQDVVIDGAELPYVERRMVEDVLSFIVSGPVFETFRDWVLPGSAFPNRHVVGHGKFDESVYSKENSIKAFLLLDSLHYVMESHDERAD